MEDITVHLTSALTSSDRRLSPEWTLKDFKQKVEQITGVPSKSQKIWIYQSSDSNDRKAIDSSINESRTTIEDLNIRPYTRIHIENTSPDPEFKELEEELLDSSDSGKPIYKLDEATYNEMPHTVKKWKKQQRLGRYDPAYKAKEEMITRQNAAKAATLHVGDRCKITKAGLERIGTIKYVGKIPEINDKDTWVGVELDEPLGKNDGSIKGKRYFTCGNKYGSFVRPLAIKVGDFHHEQEESESDDEL